MYTVTASSRSITATACLALLAALQATPAGAATAPDPTRHILTADFFRVQSESVNATPTTGVFDEQVELTALGAQGAVSRAFASQTITADGLGGFAGSGLATLTALDRATNGGLAQSGFGAAFRLLGTGQVNFQVALAEEGDADVVTVALLRRFDDLGFDTLALGNDDAPTLAFSGLLGPGDYNFFVGAQVEPGQAVSSSGTGRFSFSFSFTDNAVSPGTIPEPHSLALAFAGLVGCAAVSRRYGRR